MRHATTPAEYVALSERKARFDELSERHAMLHQVDDQRGYTYGYEHPGRYVGDLLMSRSGSLVYGDDPRDYDLIDGYTRVEEIEVMPDGSYLLDGVRWEP